MPPRTCQGFSLVEVVISLGIVAFAMLSTIGLLPLGLDAVKDSMNQTVTAGIAQEIRGELQQIPFSSTDSDIFNIKKLCDTTYAQYYGMDGIRTTEDKAYYKVTFADASAVAVAGATFIPSDIASPHNAKSITITLNYPLYTPERGRKSMVFSLLIARQTGN